MIHILWLLFTFILIINSQINQCRFAPLFNSSQLFNDQSIRQQFIKTVITWEKKFILQVGVQQSSGMTFDGQRIDYETGELISTQKHYFTASSKQSIHVGLLVKVFQGNQKAKLIYSLDDALQIIQKKVNSYEKFNNNYPGFGGFMPWVSLSKQEIQPTWDFFTRTPSLDNAQLFWPAYALSEIWQQNYPDLNPELRQRWDAITWKLMIKNARKVFFNQTTGKIRAVSNIKNISLAPEFNQYHNDDNYYLDDPYQGELFIIMITLFNTDFTDQQINNIWVDKRKKLQAANYTIKTINKTVTVERGWVFSSHQQWKNLFVPYYLSSSYWKIYLNNQKVRTWNSVDKKINGLYAATTGTANSNQDNLNYYGNCGISQVSFMTNFYLEQTTPYASFPLFLASPAHATVWYHNMLIAPSGQTKYGSVQATNITGYNVSPMLTWDTKITTVLAMLGGTTKVVQQSLKRKGLITKLYGIAFRNAVGFDVDFALPNTIITEGKKDFTNCRLSQVNLSSQE